MRFLADLRGHGRRLILLAAAGTLVMGLAACAGDGDEAMTGSPFTQALFKDYSDLANQAAALPADPAEDASFWDMFDPFTESENTSELLSKAFTAKAEMAEAGTEPELESSTDAMSATIRARLARALAAGKDQFPEQAARAQADYDCWVLYGRVPSAAAASQACKMALDSSLVRLETSGRPVAPPPPAPVAAPVPAPAPVNDFAVHFEFDSWTLKAEELTVLTNVINTARTGGQSNINVVGHTDTSGSAEYNQKLSVQRANVVLEALVQMGARRAAIHASGVGETDLAVQTEDGVKEAQNRRTVISLQP